MMSFRVVHAGGGYQYLLRSVATNDAYAGRQQLHDYYAAKGTPPGKWIGSGLRGLRSDNVQPGEVISAEQMSALYGEGLHPDTDEMTMKGTSLDACKLGRAFPLYTKNDELLADLATAERKFRAEHDRRPTEEERSDIALSVGSQHFENSHGRVAENNREIITWVNAKRNDVRQAVSGFDMTFSPMKSVSALWALADKDTANRIAEIHHRAVASTIQHVEDTALFTRDGYKGVKQVKTRGLIASEFTHFDTRAGDPDLHSHVLVSNKVQNAQGEWKSIDSRALHPAIAGASQHYNAELKRLLEKEMGLTFSAHQPDKTKQAIWELDGIPRALVQRWSARREMAKPLYDKAVAEYIETHGHAPGTKASHALWQQAILDTRDAKKPAESLDTLREQWMDDARELLGADKAHNLADSVLKRSRTHGVKQNLFLPATDVDKAAKQAVELAMSRRSSIRGNHVTTAVIQTLQHYRFASDDDYRDARDMVTKTIYNNHLVTLTPPDTIDVADKLVDRDGKVIDRKVNDVAYTTQEHLNAEQKVVDSTREPQALFVDGEKIDNALEAYAEAHGFSLNEGQAEMVRYLLTVGTQTAVGVGPAGTGKTTSMELVSRLWQAEGRQVFGLAPSAAAAAVLQKDIGTECFTIDSLTYHWDQAIAQGLSPREICATERFSHIKSGDMFLVDEAGMVSTSRMSTLVDIAHETGATIRMIGDPHQLDSVETGGLFRTLTETPGTPVLQEVMRMRYRDDNGDMVTDDEQANASLKLRSGDATGLDVHTQRGWITSGAREAMLVAAVEAYQADVAAGHRSLVVAATNADVAHMNEMIRTERVTKGEVDNTNVRTLADGLDAGRGDLILARKNAFITNPKTGVATRVMNGQVMSLEQLHKDGTITAVDTKTGERIALDSDYITHNVQLGYASTIHRCQGATVDTAHVVADSSVDRNGLYVGLTRGKRENRIYTVLDARPDELAEDAHFHSAGNSQPGDAHSILRGIVARDNSQRSALDTITDEAKRLTDPARIRDLYVHAAQTTTRQWAKTTADRYIDGLPVMHRNALAEGSDGRQAIENALVDASNKGLDPEQFWLIATDDIDWADNPGRLIGSRIRRMTARTIHTDTPADQIVPPPPRFIPGADPELALWMEKTYTEITGDTPPVPDTQDLEPGQPTTRTVASAPTGAAAMGVRRPTRTRSRATSTGAAPAGMDVMVNPNAPAYTGKRAVAAINKVREIDDILSRVTTAIDAAETAMASGEDVPDNLPERVTQAKQRVERLTTRRAELTENLPHPSMWDSIVARENSPTASRVTDTQAAKDHGMEM